MLSMFTFGHLIWCKQQNIIFLFLKAKLQTTGMWFTNEDQTKLCLWYKNIIVNLFANLVLFICEFNSF